jgi:hypothetical protein
MAWRLGQIEFTALSLRDLENMTEEGLGLLGAWLEWAVVEHNRRVSGKG